LSAAYKKSLRERADTFEAITKTRKSVLHTLITTYGLANAAEHTDVVQHVVTLDALFEP
jgi:hypothetical protein